MSATAGTIPPPVSWAQRNELLFVIIDVECKDIDHKVTENSFQFKGVNALDNSKKYEVTLNFRHPVDPERVTCHNIGRCVEFTIYKKESGPYWSSLTNDKTKLHFLKANFTKWKNESDDEDAGEGCMMNAVADGRATFDKFMNPSTDWNNKFDDFNVDDDDSDDVIPSLSQDEDDEDENNEKEEKNNQEKSIDEVNLKKD